MSNRHFRFQAAKWFPLSLDNFQRLEHKEEIEELDEIVLAGLGGIGSYVAYFLSRILTSNTELIIYDPDYFETANLAGQLVKHSQIGLSKVQAIQENLIEFSDYGNITAFEDLYTQESDVSPIMICGFDNMEARQLFYKNWKEQEDRVLFIDGRLHAEFYQVFCIYNETSEKEYEQEWLYLEQEELMQEDCTFKQTSHFAGEIACQIVKMLTKTLSPFSIPAPNFVEFNFNTYKYDIQYFKNQK